MSKFKPYRKDQLILFPNSINDYVPESHLSRVVDKVVEQLDTSKIEDKYSELGQNTYPPKILIKLLFYGYAVSERSGRIISKKCETDMAYMYLAQDYKPDFRTINDFRKNNLEELSGYFVDIVRYCQKLDLVKIGDIQINIDGTKIAANASSKNTKNKEQCEKWLQKVEEKIHSMFKEAAEIEAKEDELLGDKRGDELPEDINTQEKLKAKLEKIVKEDKQKIKAADNAIPPVKNDQETASTTPQDTQTNTDDQEVLKPKAEEILKEINSSEKLKAKLEKVITEFKDDEQRINTTGNDAPTMKGGKVKYNCQAAVTENHIIVGTVVLTDANDKQALVPTLESTEKTLAETINDVAADSGYASFDNYEYLSKNDKTGYIPDQDLSRINRLEKYHRENFTYDEQQDTYTCPQGQKLTKYGRKNIKKSRFTVYKCEDCQSCPVKTKCTKAEQRTVARDDRRPLLEQMRERLKTDTGKERYLQRMHTTEPVFGNIKHNSGYRYFLLRTLKKVNGEFNLMCTAHNIKKIFKSGVLNNMN